MYAHKWALDSLETKVTLCIRVIKSNLIVKDDVQNIEG